jgi:hypothetical protein
MLLPNTHQSLNFRSYPMKIVSALIVILFAVVGSHIHVFAANIQNNKEFFEEMWREQLAKPLSDRAKVKKDLHGYYPYTMKNKAKAEALISLLRGERRIEIKDECYVEECDAEYERRKTEGLKLVQTKRSAATGLFYLHLSKGSPWIICDQYLDDLFNLLSLNAHLSDLGTHLLVLCISTISILTEKIHKISIK